MTEAQLIHEGWHMWPYKPLGRSWMWPDGAVGKPLSRYYEWAAQGFPRIGIKPAQTDIMGAIRC